MSDFQIRFEALFQHASVGIMVTNSKGEIELANNYLLKLFGYENSDELIGKKIETLIPPRYHAGHVKQRQHYIDKPQARPMGLGMELFAMRKDGTEFPVEISLSNYQTDLGTFAIAFINDITKRKEIEQSIIEQKEELAVSKMALDKEKELSSLKSRFVSMASHEFRTPLSTILSSASLVAKYTGAEEQDKREKHIQRIKSSVNNLTDILNEFLSIGKIEDGKIVAHYSEFNVKQLISNICSELQGIMKSDQQIKYTHNGNEIITLDPTLFRNVVINLLSNAVKFSPEQSVILISTAVSPNNIVLRVKDNGIGISEEDQQHLFERFFRGTNVINIAGTGLGLHIVGKYIELMNGTINFKSQLEEGTEFIITFDNNC